MEITWRPDPARNGAFGDVNGIQAYHVHEHKGTWTLFVEIRTSVTTITGALQWSPGLGVTLESMKDTAELHLRELRELIRED